MLYAWLTAPSKAISADRLEVLRNVIHFLFLEIRDNDIYLIATGIVHSAQEHKFRKLMYDSLRLKGFGRRGIAYHRKNDRHHG